MGTLAPPPLNALEKGRLKLLPFVLALGCLVALTACASGGAQPGSPTVSPGLGGPNFDAALAMRHVQALADGIGPRPAASPTETKTEQYILAALKSYGYRIDEQVFQYQSVSDDGTLLQVLEPDNRVLNARLLIGSIPGQAEAQVIAAGSGRPEEISFRLAGNIALVQRGQLDFSEKVANAVQAGAIGVIIYNNQPGPFVGNLQSGITVPVVSISQEDGTYLLSRLTAGSVKVRVEGRAQEVVRTSHNAIARPAFGVCDVLVSAHYDSAPNAPGADDNASGVATALELARSLAVARSFDDICFAFFGASEAGFLGSQAFLKQVTSSEKASFKAVIDLDTVGVGDSWLLAGDSGLARSARDETDLTSALNEAPAGDAASFQAVGIRVLQISAVEDPRLHTDSDVSVFVRPLQLEQAAKLTTAAIRATLGQP